MRREAYQPHIENKFCFEKKWILCITEAKKTPEFLNQCSDFHLDRHFFGLVGGFIVGLFVTLPHEIVQIIRILSNMKTMKLWRKVLLQALFYFCSFMAIIWLLNMVKRTYMETMKLWRNILVMTAVMLSFASCSSDEPRYADPEAHEKGFFC